MNFSFYIWILLPSALLYLLIYFARKREGNKSFLEKFLLFLVLYSAASLIGGFLRGYFFFDQEHYGKKFNHERIRIGTDTIPSNFQLVNGPIKNWKDYFDRHRIYRLVYQTSDSSEHFRKEVDINEDGPSLELDFYRKGKDTVVKTFYYIDKTKTSKTVSAPNTALVK